MTYWDTAYLKKSFGDGKKREMGLRISKRLPTNSKCQKLQNVEQRCKSQPTGRSECVSWYITYVYDIGPLRVQEGPHFW